MATLAAIACLIAAVASHTTTKKSLDFKKCLSKHQDNLLMLRSSILSLWQIKAVLEYSLDASDEDFSNFHEAHRQIVINLESLARSGIVQRQESKFFFASSRAEIVDEMPSARNEMNLEIKCLQAMIDEIFA